MAQESKYLDLPSDIYHDLKQIAQTQNMTPSEFLAHMIQNTHDMEQSKQEVAETVRRYLAGRHPGGATLEIVEQTIRREEFAWRVLIQPDSEPPRMFEYHEALADAEAELADCENLNVFLIPGTAKADLAPQAA